MRNDLWIVGPSVERAIPDLCNYLHIASFLGLAPVFTNLHLEKSMGESRLFPINFSPILKHSGVKPSLVPRLYPCTQTNCNVKRDAVWHKASGRSGRRPSGRRLLDAASARRSAWQTGFDDVCQTGCAVWQTPRLADGHLAYDVYQTGSRFTLQLV